MGRLTLKKFKVEFMLNKTITFSHYFLSSIKITCFFYCNRKNLVQFFFKEIINLAWIQLGLNIIYYTRLSLLSLHKREKKNENSCEYKVITFIEPLKMTTLDKHFNILYGILELNTFLHYNRKSYWAIILFKFDIISNSNKWNYSELAHC